MTQPLDSTQDRLIVFQHPLKKKFIHQSHKCIQSSFKRHKTISIPHVLNNPLLDSPSPDNGAGWGWGGGCHLGPHSFFFQSFPRTSSK